MTAEDAFGYLNRITGVAPLRVPVFEGADPVIPTPFRVARAAATSVGLAASAANEIWRLRGGAFAKAEAGSSRCPSLRLRCGSGRPARSQPATFPRAGIPAKDSTPTGSRAKPGTAVSIIWVPSFVCPKRLRHGVVRRPSQGKIAPSGRIVSSYTSFHCRKSRCRRNSIR